MHPLMSVGRRLGKEAKERGVEEEETGVAVVTWGKIN